MERTAEEIRREALRRNRLDLNTPAEKAIYDAIQEVEKAGADVRLTEAVNLLSKARGLVADYVDKVEPVKDINDPVNKPAHYTDGKIEVIEFIEDKKLGFCL